MRLADLEFSDLHVPVPDPGREEGPSLAGLVGAAPWIPIRKLPAASSLLADVDRLLDRARHAMSATGDAEQAIRTKLANRQFAGLREHLLHPTALAAAGPAQPRGRPGPTRLSAPGTGT